MEMLRIGLDEPAVAVAQSGQWVRSAGRVANRAWGIHRASHGLLGRHQKRDGERAEQNRY